MIPKFIYKTAPLLTPEIKEINDLLEKKNNGWLVKFFDDNQCLDFLKNDFQNNNLTFKNNVLIAYNKLVPSAFKCDLWRLCVIYQYGGVYIDATSTLFCPLKDIFNLNKNFSIALDAKKRGLQISLFASVKNHPYLKSYISQILFNVKNNYYGRISLCPTGPTCAYTVALKYGYLRKICIPIYLSKNVYKKHKSKIIVGTRKLLDHNNIISKTEKNSYNYLWEKRKIYI